MTDFVPVMTLTDLPEGTATKVELNGVDVCLVHSLGQVYAIDATCSHADVSLSEGDVEGCFIECWLHGSRFDLRTGEPTGPPATLPVPVYQTRVVGDGDDAMIFVSANQGGGHTWQS
ncbi:MAG: non-heme iron oxygenase ferredoxin subunit [Actinomycetes bacterium]